MYQFCQIYFAIRLNFFLTSSFKIAFSQFFEFDFSFESKISTCDLRHFSFSNTTFVVFEKMKKMINSTIDRNVEITIDKFLNILFTFIVKFDDIFDESKIRDV